MFKKLSYSTKKLIGAVVNLIYSIVIALFPSKFSLNKVYLNQEDIRESF